MPISLPVQPITAKRTAMIAAADNSCACRACRACCHRTPGWFAPGEAEKAAELLGVSFEEFKHRYLIVNYWDSPSGDTFVLAPKKLDETGTPIGADCAVASLGYNLRYGRCVFLDENELCSIHAAKPMECRLSFGCKVVNGAREAVVRAWQQSGADPR